jgi:DNA-binding CsgD family transcriptional regulator
MPHLREDDVRDRFDSLPPAERAVLRTILQNPRLQPRHQPAPMLQMPALTVEALNALHHPPFGLTPRELDVLRYMFEDLSNKETGRALGISPRTVEVHRGRVFLKTGVSGMAGLIRLIVAVSQSQLPRARSS